MRHDCTCGHQLAPEDGVEPVGEVSHGLCVPCAMRVLRTRNPYWYTMRIGGFTIEMKIRPGRGAPHVSYDSPRKWDQPEQPRVIEQRVSHDGVQLDPAEFRDLLNLACERANVPSPGGRPSVRPVFSRQLKLAMDEGHLTRAFERTGYQDGGAS